MATGSDAPRHLDGVVALGATWIAQTPFGWMDGPHDPSIRLVTGGRVLWGESDAGLGTTHRRARQLGLRTMLKPHIWMHGSWPGEVSMATEEEWGAWFDAYTRFIVHYAELAEREGIDLFVVGTELKATTAAREADWRRVVARVRAAYRGPITYAANWDEAEHVPFWDALDYVGIDAYFPIAPTSGAEAPTRDDLVAAWQPWTQRLAELAARTGKRVLFTEAGYRPVARCTERPWEHDGGRGNEACQARAWEALLVANGAQPWFAGLFVWKWFPSPADALAHPASFSPQGRYAEDVLRRWFTRAGGTPAAPAR